MSIENQIWSNSMYYIEITPPFADKDVGQVYSLVNIETNVREGEYSFLPQAMQYGIDLANTMDEILAKESEVDQPELELVPTSEPVILQ